MCTVPCGRVGHSCGGCRRAAGPPIPVDAPTSAATDPGMTSPHWAPSRRTEHTYNIATRIPLTPTPAAATPDRVRTPQPWGRPRFQLTPRGPDAGRLRRAGLVGPRARRQPEMPSSRPARLRPIPQDTGPVSGHSRERRFEDRSAGNRRKPFTLRRKLTVARWLAWCLDGCGWRCWARIQTATAKGDERP